MNFKEPYNDQAERCKNQLKEAIKQFSFYHTVMFDNLVNDLEEALFNNDLEECQEIFLEIEQEKTSFERSLPDWYKIRWGIKQADGATFKKACEIYSKNIYEKKVF